LNIVLPLLSAASNISGVQRHAINLAKSLLHVPAITHVHVIAGDWQKFVISALPKDPRLHVEFARTKNTHLGRNRWFLTQLPGICRGHRADLVHLAYPLPFRRKSFAMPVVLTLHDLYVYDVPGNFGFPKVLFNRAILKECLHSADAITCVSDSTWRRLYALAPDLAMSRAVTIPNIVEPIAAEPDRPNALQDGDQFLLCVAQHRRNKNIHLLLETFLALHRAGRIAHGMRLVVVGIPGPETQEIERFIKRHSLQYAVSLLAGISEGELRWCYRSCALLVAPSSFEGFGLPIAEGALEGCRIVCSDIPSFREVGGTQCRYVALDEIAVERLGNAIVEELARPLLGPIVLPLYSSGAIAMQYVRLWGSLIQNHRTRAGATPFVALQQEKELEA
jgi:glycosyltransferase involved in cell wall biosynthesis